MIVPVLISNFTSNLLTRNVNVWIGFFTNTRIGGAANTRFDCMHLDMYR
jgi:hypothetical protein